MADSIVCNEPVAEIIGYAEPWIVAPGDSVAIKVSCTEPEYKYRFVRLIQGIDLTHSPPKAEEEIHEIPRGQKKGRSQVAHPGSFGYVENWVQPAAAAEGVEISFYVQPWMTECPHAQTLLSTLDLERWTGFKVVLNTEGLLVVCIGNGKDVQTVSTGLTPRLKIWSKVEVVLERGSLRVSLVHKAFRVEPVPPPATFETHLESDPSIATSGSLFLAAAGSKSPKEPRTSKPVATDFFNGRIDSLMLKTTGQKPTILARYDFSQDMSGDRIIDISGHGLDGVLVNAPTRAVKGHDWDGTESDWTRAEYGYGAIHFHDDDLDDANWDTDFTITIPTNARSGAYTVEVETLNGRDKDSITFFVRPNSWTEDTSGKVCLVFSTFTYLAYANERIYDTTRINTADLGPGFDINKALKSEEFYKMQRRTDLGLSVYDRHNDGSGVCYSTSKRPILNVRPGYIMWGFSRPREFSADLMMLGFLEREGIPYEILTDHDLHARGASALHGFNTVITGCHPEYPSLASFRAYDAFAKEGGNLMYLGGNGFYWVSSLSTVGTRLEVRRGDQGVRPYSLPGGEHVNSQDGQRGGLWRSRGMSCNTLFGVGFCAQGTTLGVPYQRTEASKVPKLAWMFTGVSENMIGEHGFGGGASGDEIDRFDITNGSPGTAIILASSTGHSDDFGIAVEDLDYPALNTLGTQTDRIRSDIVYYVGTGGGAVFSVGSINWYCSLAWDGYKNDVARLTRNVIKGFLAGKR